MPCGLTGAPARFSRLMDKVLDGLIGKKCLVHLDNVIIYGSTFEETLANLKLVMSHLREHKLLCKARKWQLFEMSIAFLGHVVSKDGIATDPMKLLQAVHQELLCNNSPLQELSRKLSTSGSEMSRKTLSFN